MACPLIFGTLGGNHVPERAHHHFQPAGNLAVRVLEPPRAATLMVELGGEPVALRCEAIAFISQGAKLLLELDSRLAIFEKLTQKPLEAVERRTEPHQSLLQSVSLGHH